MRVFTSLIAFFVISCAATAQDFSIESFFNQMAKPSIREVVPPSQFSRLPRERHSHGGTVLATWYGGGEKLSSHTANGERFNPSALTAAHKTLAFGTRVRFTNPKNGRSIVARITDRGPFRKGYSYDLSRGTARAIGFNSGAIAAAIMN